MGRRDDPVISGRAGDPLADEAPRVPGAAETALDHFTHGFTMKNSDELYGGALAVGQTVANALGVEKHPESFGTLYKTARDKRRALLDTEKQANPITAKGADIAGSIAPALLPGGLAIAGTRAGAAGMGGVMAAANSMGDQAEGVNLAKTAQDSAVGATLGRVGFDVGKLGGPLAAALREKAIEAGRKVLNGGRRALSVKAPVSSEAVQEALDIGAIRPLSTTKATAERLGQASDAVGDQYSKIVAALEAKGITGPDAQALAQKIAAEGQAAGQQTLNTGVPRVYESVADQLPTKAQGPLGLAQAESLKRSLQRKARYDNAVPGADYDVNGARQDVASMLREAVEETIAKQAYGPEAKAIAAQFVPTKNQYGRLAEATRTAERAAAQTANSGGPSLTDTITGAAYGAAHGAGAGILAKQAASQWRQRGPSTVAWLADALAPQAAKIGPGLTTRAGWAADDPIQALIEALRAHGETR